MTSMVRYACLAVAGAAIAPSIGVSQGLPDAKHVVETMLRMRAERLEGVSDYTLVQSLNGAETTLYFERVMVDGQPAFRIVMPDEYQKKALDKAGLTGGTAGRSGAPGTGRTAGQTAGSGGLPALLRDLPIPGGLPLPGGLPGGSGGTGAFRADGSTLQKAGGVALGAATGGLQQQLMQKASQSVVRLATSSGGEGTEDAALPVRALIEFARLSRVDGFETVDGRRCYVLRASIQDPELARRLSGNSDFAVRTLALWVDVDEYVPRRAVTEGTIAVDGRQQEMAFEVRSQKYRRVGQMYEPFHVVMVASGMSAAMESADPKKAEQIRKDAREATAKMAQLEEMLARMPPEQRRMAEAQMGVARERLSRFSEGGFDAMETVTEVRELRVNAGPPTPFGTGEIVAEGGAAFRLADVIVQLSQAADPSGRRGWIIQAIGAREGEVGGVVQVKVVGKLPPSGATSANAGASFRWNDGKEAQLTSSEGGAEVTITSRSTSRVTGEFSFRGTGPVGAAGAVNEAAIVIRGRFDVPIPPSQ